jgi:F-type H+-transporting ATPase subunit a
MIISMEGLSLSHVYMGLVAMAISVVLVLLAGKPSIKPTKFQALWEGYIRFVKSMVIENMGHEGFKVCAFNIRYWSFCVFFQPFGNGARA